MACTPVTSSCDGCTYVALNPLLVEFGGIIVFELGAHAGAVRNIVLVEFLLPAGAVNVQLS